MKARTREDLIGKYAIPCTEGFVWLEDWHKAVWLSDITGNEDDDNEEFNVLVYDLDGKTELTRVASIDVDMK